MIGIVINGKLYEKVIEMYLRMLCFCLTEYNNHNSSAKALSKASFSFSAMLTITFPSTFVTRLS